MLQIRNETPFTPGLFLFPDERGVDTLYPVLKATFLIRDGSSLAVAEKQRPVVMKDEYEGEPGASSLRYSSEAHLLKPGTDVLLVGQAHAPRGRPVDSALVSVKVGALRQVLRVFGERHWKGGLFSPTPSSPEPFRTMPLIWERAFGGIYETAKGQLQGEARNPVGQGFRGKRSASEMIDRALPNIEDPLRLIGSIGDAPSPVGVGALAPSWEPRKAHAGTYDEAWRKRRAPYLPRDFRAEFFHVAPPALRATEGLKGGEPVELLGVSSSGVERFELPRCELAVVVRIAGRPEKVPLQLETVLLEPGEMRVCLTWRGALGCDKRALQVEEVSFSLKSLHGGRG